METLKQFFDNVNIDNKLVAIVPIANDKFETKKESFLKCLNFVEYFDFSNIKMVNFVEEIFEDEFIRDELSKNQIISFLEVVFDVYNDMTPRMLKFILRKANFNFKRQVDNKLEPDFRTTIIFEFSKYLKKGETGTLYFNLFKRNNTVTRGSIFSKSLFMILENAQNLYVDHDGKKSIPDSDLNFQFTERDSRYPTFPSRNWFIRNRFSDKEAHWGLCDFYLKY